MWLLIRKQIQTRLDSGLKSTMLDGQSYEKLHRHEITKDTITNEKNEFELMR